jgi:hypothetical protein
LLDSDGNPLLALQFPSSLNFISASFIATLSQTTFVLPDGSSPYAAPLKGFRCEHLTSVDSI